MPRIGTVGRRGSACAEAIATMSISSGTLSLKPNPHLLEGSLVSEIKTDSYAAVRARNNPSFHQKERPSQIPR